MAHGKHSVYEHNGVDKKGFFLFVRRVYVGVDEKIKLVSFGTLCL